MNDDLIRRGALAEEVKSLTVYVTGLRDGKGVLQEYVKQYRDSLLRIIDEQPAVDAVEVVRCKDCESATHCEEEGEPVRLVCPMWGANCDENEFCSRGERRKDDA